MVKTEALAAQSQRVDMLEKEYLLLNSDALQSETVTKEQMLEIRDVMEQQARAKIELRKMQHPLYSILKSVHMDWLLDY